MKTFKWVLLCSALCSAPAYAQLGTAPLPQNAATQGASLEDTQRWIIDKLHEIGPRPLYVDPDSRRRQRFEAFFDGCKFTLIEASNFLNISAMYKGNLADLVADPKGPDLAIIGNAKKIMRESKEFDAELTKKLLNGDREAMTALMQQKWSSPSPWSMPEFDTVDDVMKARLSNAFLHAAQLCRAEEAARRQEEQGKWAKKPGELF